MGVLRIKDRVDTLLEQDPYELFTIQDPHKVMRRARPEFWGAACIGVLVAFAAACLVFWNAQRDHGSAALKPFAYFEIKVIDLDGRPVAGAAVRQGERHLGVTDTFGEWRRFMRVKPGMAVNLQISKKVGEQVYAADKNIAVPANLPTGRDLELTGSVQLKMALGPSKAPARNPPGGNGVADTASPAVESAEAPAVPAPVLTKQITPAPTELAANNEVDGASADAVISAAAAQATPGAAAQATTAAAETPKPEAEAATHLAADFTNVGFVLDTPGIAAAVKVAEAIGGRAGELGLTVSAASPWQVHISDLAVDHRPGGEGTHLLKVDGLLTTGGQQSRVFSFLRTYNGTALQTARDILWSITMHVPKTHRVRHQGQQWLLAANTPKLWQLGPGRHVLDAKGRDFMLVAAGTRLAVLTGPVSPCAVGSQEPCVVTTPSLAQRPPMPGWQRLKLKVYGADTGVSMYVAGYETQKLDEHTHEYWGQPMGSAIITAVRGGRVIYRGHVQAKGGSAPIVSLPAAPVSRR